MKHFVLLVLVAGGILSGCVGNLVNSSSGLSTDELRAKTLVAYAALEKAYEQKDSMGFESHVSRNYQAGYLSFSSGMRQTFDQFHRIEIESVPGNARMHANESKVSLPVDWRRRRLDPDGNFVRNAGRTEFIFQSENDEMKLTNQIGPTLFE